MEVLVLLSACNKNSDGAKNCVENTFFYLDKGDFEKAINYCKENSEAYQLLKEGIDENLMASVSGDLSNRLEEKIKSDGNFNSLVRTYKKYLYNGYNIISTQNINEKSSKVIVETEQINTEELQNCMDEIDDMISQYYYANYDKLNDIYKTEGEDAMTVKILDGILVKFCQKLKDTIINDCTYNTCKYSVTVDLFNENWYITNIIKDEI